MRLMVMKIYILLEIQLNLSDEDSFMMGEISGNIETLKKVIEELEDLIGNKQNIFSQSN